MTKSSTQAPVSDLLSLALQFHRQNRLKEAETLYRRILQGDPDHFDALYWLGLLHLGRNEAEPSIPLLNRARRVRPSSADALIYLGHALNTLKRYEEALICFDNALLLNRRLPLALNNRGLALNGLKRFDEALACFDQALALEPRLADALNNRGIALEKLGRKDQALASWRRALALNPNHIEALCNAGDVLMTLARHEDALASFERALAISPGYLEALQGQGLALQTLGRHEEAVAVYEKALTLKPDDPDMLGNLGVSLLKMKRHAEALEACDKALTLKRGSPEVLTNRGAVLLALHRPAEALASLDAALAIQPDSVEALLNRGNTLQALCRHLEALETYRQALAIEPDHPGVLANESLARLCLGDFRIGWEHYECRWTRTEAPPERHFGTPKWLGEEDLAGKRLLLWAEQGLGDTLQFCRYVPILARRGIEVFMEVQPPLKELMATLEGVAGVTATGEAPPPHDYHCPLLSLPLAVGPERSDIPDVVPYLLADGGKVKAWVSRLGHQSGLRVGIVCSGNPGHAGDRLRSIPLRFFAPLLEAGLTLYFMQKECRPEDEAFLAETPQICDLRPELTDFGETAAAISCMDLVISVDTSVAHLAGALGKSVWILIPYSPDWRWLLDRNDSPWYPTMTLFRQPALGDWQSVIAAVGHALGEYAARARKQNDAVAAHVDITDR